MLKQQGRGPLDASKAAPQNYAAAQHLADVPVALPDLTEVLAEVARTDLVSDGLGDSTATVS